MFTNNNYTDRYQASNLSLNFYSELRPLISKSDKVLISLYNYCLNQMFKSQDKGNDQQLTKLLIVLQILLIRTLEMYREQYGEYA